MVGTTLADRYVLYDRVATGGMGTVFRATDSRLHREVAVKVLKDEYADDPRFVERFRREARAAAALSHPNVAGVFDYGEDAGGHFIVMELVKGRDLARVLREEGPLSEDRSVRIAIQIAEALAHAHEAGLIHRDIKPGNVIIDSNDRVKVTDFGIARAQAETSLTATGSVLGTAQYISPEQASGEEVSAATDIYSLGIVLYEMLTGSVPFTGDSALAVAMRHVKDDVPAPSSLKRGLAPQLDEAVARATARDPVDRYRTAGDVAVALTAIAGGAAVPVAAPPTTPMAGAGTTAVIGGGGTTQMDAETWPFPGHPSRWDPHKLGRWVIAIFVILLLVASGLLLYRLASSDRPRDQRAERRGDRPAAVPPATEETEAEGYVLPDLTGTKKKDAEKLLKDQGINVVSEKVENDEWPKDFVVDTEPGEGATVFPGETVTLYVSEPPKGEEDVVDDVTDSFTPPGQAKKDEEDGDD